MYAALMLLKDNAIIVGLLLAVWGSWKVAGWKSVVDASLQLQAQNIDRLGKNIQALTNNVSRLDAKVDALSDKIDAQISRLDAKVDALSDKIDAQISRLDAKVDALSDKIDALSKTTDTQIAALSNKIDTQIANLSKTTDTQIANLSKTTDTQIAALSDKIDTLSKTMDTQLAALSDKTDTRFTTMSQRLDGLQHMFATFLDNQITKSASPRTLTDYGTKLSRQIDAPSLAAHYIPRLREKMGETSPMNPWQIQELCFNHAEHEIMKDLQQHDTDRYNQITMCAYREGLDLSQIMRVVGIVMRDQLLQQTGQTPSRAQPDPAFPGGDPTLGMSHA